MAKTYYLGRTKKGAVVARGSAADYGYTHAAVLGQHAEGSVVPLRDLTFSRSEQGALSNAASRRVSNPEIVALSTVSVAEFKAATGKR